jgi:hypothetical protein
MRARVGAALLVAVVAACLIAGEIDDCVVVA